jgi:hypothetical protein
MDLLSHPSLIFFETGYSLHTLRQASRRSWRIGQRQPVRVFYLQYDDTMQASCLRLMGKKLLVSLAMEGKFCREGLQELEEDDDILTAMARELVTEKGVGETAAAVWRQLQVQHDALLEPAVISPVAPPVIDHLPPPPPPVASRPNALPCATAPKFGTVVPPPRCPSRKDAPPLSVQFTLF